MTTPNFYEPLTVVADALEQLGVRYYVGGSVASTVYGVRRSTADIDIVADLGAEHVGPFVSLTEDRFYVDAGAALEAIQLGLSFNLIDLRSAGKIDVFIMQRQPFSHSEMDRAQAHQLAPDSRAFPIASAEDIVLRKLLWYVATGEQSERQWSDVVGVLKVQAPRLDREYLRQWAADLGVVRLLERAASEAGLGL
jgi:hypothetical protein